MARARVVETVPYANARSGIAAREEISTILRKFGCEQVGFMDEYEEHAVLLHFRHRGRDVQLRASAKGWAALYLKARHDYEQAALRQGGIAVNSILRDWVKGQITAVECGVMPFEAVFMPHVITNDGRTVFERLANNPLMLPPPSGA
jgi:hypothetical protein